MSVFFWHSGYQALIVPTQRGPLAIPIATLQQAGWHIEADEVVTMLPRANAPTLLDASGKGDIEAAARESKLCHAVGEAFKRGPRR